jgi:PAS domain S-box-containing protein
MPVNSLLYVSVPTYVTYELQEVEMQEPGQDKLKKLEWMLDEAVPLSDNEKDEYIPPYGDVTELNTCRLIMDSVGAETLKEIGNYAVKLLDTSVAIYETNGDYAFGMFSSGWCRLMDFASRKLCKTDDNQEALSCGKWLCHENCWNDSAKKAIETGRNTDIECVGGIHLYAEPIYAGKRVIGTINIGYGDPPNDPDQLKALADAFGVDPEKLKEIGERYKSRPKFIVDVTKKLLGAFAKLIGEIVEKAEAEKALRRNEKDLRESQRISHVGSWRLDVATNQVVWTEELYNMYGFDPSLPPPPYTEHMKLFTPESWDRLSTALARTKETGIPYTLELETARKDGSNGWMWVRGEAEIDSSGKTVELWGAAQDISERKQAEKAMETSERFLRSTLDGLTAHIAVLDEQGEIILTNKAYRDFGERNGIDPCAVSEGTNYLAVCDTASGEHSQEADPFAEGIREVLSGNRRSFELEYPCHSPDEKRWFIGRITPIQGEGPRRVVVAHENITEQKRAEERRQEGFDLLKNLARLVPGVIYQYRLYPDGRSAFPYSSPGMYDIYEVTPEEIREDASVVFGRIHPEDHDRVAEAIFESARTLNTFHCELRVILPKQGLRWRWSQAHPVRTEDGGTLWHGIILDITERKQLEAERLKFFLLAESSSEFIGMCDLDMNPLYVNPAGRRMVGLPDMAAACRVKVQDYFFPEDQRFISEEFFPRVLREGKGDMEIRLRHFQTGEPIWVFYYLFSVRDASGTPVGWATVSHDITEQRRAEAERKKLQDQLTQAQKMESVGRLAGGVAHDFNNMLSVILGNTEMAMADMAPDNPLHNKFSEIFSAARRSADITRQLLAFARKQTIAPTVLNLNDTIGSMLKMLRRLIGEDIDLAWLPAANIRPVRMDPSQIDQILANLCVNARDAIADVGKITIETGNATFDSTYCAEHPGFVAGDFVLLAVSDDGCGMNQDTLANLFEPFFTTKDMGKGTGLGLSTVYGIVKQNNGFINVYSEPDQGTTFRIYLPRYLAETESPEKKTSDKINLNGTETILLVEDEPSILKMTRMMLERMGYKVLAAGRPGDAISLAREHAGEIHLLMTDVVMPEMNGRDLAQNVLSLYPRLKCLFMSGFTSNVIAHHGVLDEGVQFIQKPFSREQLGIRVRDALDEDNL